MNLYIFVLSSKYDRQQIIDHLSQENMIGQWFYSMPHSFFARSRHSADELSQEIKKKFGKNRHFISQVNSEYSERQGWLPKEHWDLIYKKD